MPPMAEMLHVGAEFTALRRFRGCLGTGSLALDTFASMNEDLYDCGTCAVTEGPVLQVDGCEVRGRSTLARG